MSFIRTTLVHKPQRNVSLVNRLILDAGLTAELVKLWKEQTLDGIMARFVATDGSRESGYESGILVSKAVDLNLHQCKDEICGCLKNDKHVDCVLLDDGGFLLMSNQEEYITQTVRGLAAALLSFSGSHTDW
ncbi:hypothetical protein CRUP_019719 [Coryphaenoides rupestris]|nr:hypothetical protein CRUP_019719 [Coryphaenoides rupestris]